MAKTKLNPHLRSALLKCIEQGLPLYRAAAAVGVSERSVRRWIEWGENPRGPEDNIYVRLAEEIERSKAKFIQKNLEIIQNAAKRDAHHAEWLLERRFPAEFAKRVEMAIGPSKALIALQDAMVEELSKPNMHELPEAHDVNKLEDNVL